MKVYAVYEFGVLIAVFKHEDEAVYMYDPDKYEINEVEVPDELFH